MSTEVISVSVLHGEVKFQYANGCARALNEPEVEEFFRRYEKCRHQFSTNAGRVKVHVANTYFH